MFNGRNNKRTRQNRWKKQRGGLGADPPATGGQSGFVGENPDAVA